VADDKGLTGSGLWRWRRLGAEEKGSSFLKKRTKKLLLCFG
jgi:hypothetical protein